ncbi:MAG: GNAT family N-acetyltransferase [Gaiellales bacterium]
MTEIVRLSGSDEAIVEQAAQLIHTQFDGPTGWRRLEDARDEVAEVVRHGLAFGAVEAAALVGWVGGLIQYDGRVVELHPLVVHRDWRGRGIGRSLVRRLENEASGRGAFTVVLGTDDDTGMTSLAGVDLYDDLPARLAGLRDLGRGHPSGFYRALGYTVVGVVPDANGPGKPDILMAKRLSERAAPASGARRASSPSGGSSEREDGAAG